MMDGRIAAINIDDNKATRQLRQQYRVFAAADQAKISVVGTEKPGSRSEQFNSSSMVRIRTLVNER